MRLTTVIVLFFMIAVTQAQVGNAFMAESRMTFQSEDKLKQLFEANTENSYMLLNMTNGEFLLNSDLSTLKTGNAKFDSVLMSKGRQIFSFKGNISENLFLFNQQVNDEKMYNMQGQLTINNITVDCVAQFDPVNYADKADSRNYRIDFRLSVDPTKFVLPGLENKVNKQLVIEVKGGKLNTQQ